MKNSQSNGTVATEAAPKSKFTLGAGLSIMSVKSGERVSNDTIPTLETSSQINKFKMNKLASELLGIVPGGRVKLLITGSEEIDGKYLICVAPETDATSAKVLSPTAADGFGSLLFNYAGVWSRMAQMTTDASEKSGETFVEEGVAVKRSKTFYIDRKVIYELVEVENFTAETPLVDPNTGVEYAKVFALVAPKSEAVDITKEVTPRKKADVVVEEVVSEFNPEAEAEA